MTRDNDPVQVAPHVYSVLFENDRVRVLDVRMAPGGGRPAILTPTRSGTWCPR
jgi:hypothetical protein